MTVAEALATLAREVAAAKREREVREAKKAAERELGETLAELWNRNPGLALTALSAPREN